MKNLNRIATCNEAFRFRKNLFKKLCIKDFSKLGVKLTFIPFIYISKEWKVKNICIN